MEVSTNHWKHRQPFYYSGVHVGHRLPDTNICTASLLKSNKTTFLIETSAVTWPLHFNWTGIRRDPIPENLTCRTLDVRLHTLLDVWLCHVSLKSANMLRYRWRWTRVSAALSGQRGNLKLKLFKNWQHHHNICWSVTVESATAWKHQLETEHFTPKQHFTVKCPSCHSGWHSAVNYSLKWMFSFLFYMTSYHSSIHLHVSGQSRLVDWSCSFLGNSIIQWGHICLRRTGINPGKRACRLIHFHL